MTRKTFSDSVKGQSFVSIFFLKTESKKHIKRLFSCKQYNGLDVYGAEAHLLAYLPLEKFPSTPNNFRLGQTQNQDLDEDKLEMHALAWPVDEVGSPS